MKVITYSANPAEYNHDTVKSSGLHFKPVISNYQE